MSKLEERLIEKGRAEVSLVSAEAATEAESVYRTLIEEAKVRIGKKRSQALESMNSGLSRAKAEAERSLKEEALIVKQKLIESVFSQVEDYLISLEGADLSAYIVNKLQKEKIAGDEVIAVGRKEYSKYLKALSSKTGSLADCDLINDKLGTKLKLTKTPALIEHGFMVIGKEYDLNFSFRETIDNLAAKYEKKIFEDLE